MDLEADVEHDSSPAASPTADAHALAAWENHMATHDTVIRALAARHAEEAAERMIHAALRSYKRLKPERFEEGDRVRVSFKFLTLSSVRAVVKSRMLGELIPVYSPKVYKVQRVHDHGSLAFYDVSTDEDGENGRKFPSV